MAVLFNKAQRKNPRTKEVGWFPVVKSIKRVDEHEVARLVADETTLNPMEAEMAVAQLEKVVLRLLQQGYTVKLGGWASFNLTVRAEGAATEKECTSALIKQVRPHCRFAARFLEQVQRTEFRPADSLKKKEKKEEPEG